MEIAIHLMVNVRIVMNKYLNFMNLLEVIDNPDKAVKLITNLQVENERLREALERIRDGKTNCLRSDNECCFKVADNALRGE